jgi:hypothetical protein
MFAFPELFRNNAVAWFILPKNREITDKGPILGQMKISIRCMGGDEENAGQRDALSKLWVLKRGSQSE